MSSFCVKHGGHAIKYGKVLFSDMEIASTSTTVGGTKLWYYGGLQLSLSAFYGVSTTSNKVYPIITHLFFINIFKYALNTVIFLSP